MGVSQGIEDPRHGAFKADLGIHLFHIVALYEVEYLLYGFRVPAVFQDGVGLSCGLNSAFPYLRKHAWHRGKGKHRAKQQC
jgi:hypothetical protein